MADYEGMTVREAVEAEKAADAEGVEEVVDTTDPGTDLDEVREELGIAENVDPLAALLDAPDEPPRDVVFIKRLGATFTVEAITDDAVYDNLVERCTKIVRSRRGGGRREVDGRRLARLTVAEYCVNPAFKASRGRESYEALVKKYGSKEPEDLVDRALLLGEIDLIADKILAISGFEDDGVELAGN